MNRVELVKASVVGGVLSCWLAVTNPLATLVHGVLVSTLQQRDFCGLQVPLPT